MNLYRYIDNSRTTVFETYAEDILDADAQARAAGFNPLKLSCAITKVVPLEKQS